MAWLPPQTISVPAASASRSAGAGPEFREARAAVQQPLGGGRQAFLHLRAPVGTGPGSSRHRGHLTEAISGFPSSHGTQPND